jgi:hypothetical protein
MTNNNTDTPTNGFVDLLGPLPPPQPGTKGFRQTERVAKLLDRATTELAALPLVQRRSKAFEKIRDLFGYGYRPSRLKIPSQPGNLSDLGTVFVNMVNAVRGLQLDRGQQLTIEDREVFEEIRYRLSSAIKDITETADVRVRAIEALDEFLVTSGIGIDG